LELKKLKEEISQKNIEMMAITKDLEKYDMHKATAGSLKNGKRRTTISPNMQPKLKIKQNKVLNAHMSNVSIPRIPTMKRAFRLHSGASANKESEGHQGGKPSLEVKKKSKPRLKQVIKPQITLQKSDALSVLDEESFDQLFPKK